MYRRLSNFSKRLGHHSWHFLVAFALILSLSWLSGCASHDRSVGGGSNVTLVKVYLADASAPDQELGETWSRKIKQIKYLCLMGLYSDGSVKELDCSWVSGDPLVASVDEDGAVTVKSSGSTNLTASSSEGYSANLTINAVGSELSSLNCINNESGAVVSSTVNVKLDQEVDFIAGGTFTDGEQSQVEGVWSSSDESIATVSDAGKPGVVKIHGKSMGTATISCTCLNKTTEIQVEVVAGDPESRTQSISFGDDATVQLILSKENPSTKQLKVTATMSDGSEQTIVGQYCDWSSSDETVATVGLDGTITGVGLGTATITCKYDGKEAECAVTVQTGELKSIRIEPDAISLVINLAEKSSKTIKVVAEYSGSVEQEVKLADCTISYAMAVVNVDNDGTVTAVGKGETNLMCEYNGVQNFCDISVGNGDLIGIRLDPSTLSEDVEAENQTLTAYAQYENGEEEKLDSSVCFWNATKAGVVSVSAGVVDFLAVGETDVFCLYHDFDASCHVTVSTKVKNVVLSPTSLEVEYTKTAAFNSVTVEYTDGSQVTVELDNCSWRSGNENYAKVSKGVVSGEYPGYTTIYCKYGDIEVGAQVKVTGKAVSMLYIVPESQEEFYNTSGSRQYTLFVMYTDYTTETVTNCEWTIADPTVATVSNGLVTPLKSGSTTLKATYKNFTTSPYSLTITFDGIAAIEFDQESYDVPSGGYVDIPVYMKRKSGSRVQIDASSSDFEYTNTGGEYASFFQLSTNGQLLRVTSLWAETGTPKATAFWCQYQIYDEGKGMYDKNSATETIYLQPKPL